MLNERVDIGTVGAERAGFGACANRVRGAVDGGDHPAGTRPLVFSTVKAVPL
jgi:hypothetical protein